MKNEDINKILERFEVPEASEDAKIECLNNVTEALSQSTRRRAVSLWGFIKTQISYMEKGKLACFYLFFLLITICLGIFPFTDEIMVEQHVLRVSISVVSFLILPQVFAMFRSHKSKMLEIEESCKYNLQKMVFARLLINGIIALFAILILWIITGRYLNSYVISRLFCSVTSYNVSLICCLWFGRHAMIKGIIASSIWSVLVCIVVQSKAALQMISSINKFGSFEAVLLSFVVLIYVMYRYIKFTSFESENTRWNLILTD